MSHQAAIIARNQRVNLATYLNAGISINLKDVPAFLLLLSLSQQ